MDKKTDVRDPDEKVVEIEMERLRAFPNHPFKVIGDSQMIELQDSIKKYGVLNPLIVRPKIEGYYEIISGHRRKYAAEKLGYKKIPVIIRMLQDDEAVVIMVDSNLQREQITPSEKAYAYKMKYDAIKKKAGRKNCSQVNHNTGKRSIDVIGELCGDSAKQVQRYIKITELIPALLDKVDDGTMGFIPAVQLSYLKKKEQQEEAPSGKKTKTYDPDHWIDIEEIDAILARTYHANKHEKGATKQWRTAKKVISGDNAPRYAPVKAVSKEEYLLVDGYNIIFAWESLKELAAVNIDGARGKLLDILCNYQGIKKCNLIVVFDAYRVKGHQTEMLNHHNIHVVYTKEAETADAYIEKFAHENGRKYHVTVATSDGLEQIIITGQGCHLLSAREFEREVEAANQTLRETIDGMREKSSNHILGDALKQLTDEKIQLQNS